MAGWRLLPPPEERLARQALRRSPVRPQPQRARTSVPEFSKAETLVVTASDITNQHTRSVCQTRPARTSSRTHWRLCSSSAGRSFTPVYAFLEIRASERSYDAFLELRASEHPYDALVGVSPHDALGGGALV